jgi:6-pyruvoyltetrahydropterin/6-carboxytetrahydropterin synthase
MRLGKHFIFDAAHFIRDYKGKCERVHGHTYRLEVVIEDSVKEDGMVLDFSILKKVVDDEVIEALDHSDLNGILPNPTAENIVEWVWKRLEDKLPLYSVRIWEGDRKWAQKVRD